MNLKLTGDTTSFALCNHGDDDKGQAGHPGCKIAQHVFSFEYYSLNFLEMELILTHRSKVPTAMMVYSTCSETLFKYKAAPGNFTVL